MTQRRIVYLVGMHDYPPDAVFSTREAAVAWAAPRGDVGVMGPYAIDEPDWEAPEDES